MLPRSLVAVIVDAAFPSNRTHHDHPELRRGLTCAQMQGRHKWHDINITNAQCCTIDDTGAVWKLMQINVKKNLSLEHCVSLIRGE